MAHLSQQLDGLIEPVRRNRHEVTVEAGGHPHGEATVRQRSHERTQHPDRIRIMGLVTVPKRSHAFQAASSRRIRV
jgi:hypothetical protein